MSTATRPIKAEMASPPEAPKITAAPGIALERRRIVIVCAGLFVVLGSAILLAMMTNLSSKIIQPVGPRDTFGIEERNGSIVLKAENNRCRHIAFNNDTGRMVESSKPCINKPVLDDKGVPVPAATMRRMDSIRQGFGK
jgi:low affinity Fe/Cu permease